MSVWDVIEDKPAEAETMKLRASLIMALDRHIRTKGWTEAEAARWFGVTPPRISDSYAARSSCFPLTRLSAC